MITPKCYLFDLNGTLIFQIRDPNVIPKVYIRPQTLELLKYLKSQNSGLNKIYIATSMVYKNVVLVLNYIYPKWKTLISGIFDRTYTLSAATEELPYRTVRNVRKIAQYLGVYSTDLTFVDNDLDKYVETNTKVIIVSTYTGNSEDSELNSVFNFLEV